MISPWKNIDSDAPVNVKAGLRFGAVSDIGQVREENEDSYGFYPQENPHLFIVCDGMGGHEDGGVASRMARDVIIEHYAASQGSLPQRMEAAVKAANRAINEASGTNMSIRRMGTTCTALVFEKGNVTLAHVGDSRAYRVSPEALFQVSDDHTVAAEMIASGLLTPGQAASHPQRNALTRALGSAPDVNVLIRDLGTVSPGEKFIICSDGLAPVSLGEVHRAVTQYDPQEAAEWLVTQANAAGGPDNVTVLVIEALDVTE